ncbi:MAG TPA: flagellar motor protein MotB [Propionibacteriaceae bacterium]|jgi:chemotaxis protein MotB
MSAGGSSGRKRKGKHEEHEEHVNHERWLVSYADMLTLLFVLFVVLFSMSTVDQKKFAKLADGLSQGFGAQSAAFSGTAAQLDGSGQSTDIVRIDPGANPGLGGDNQKESARERAATLAVAAASRAKASKDADAATREAANLKKIEQRIADALAKVKLRDTVKFTIDERGLVITVVTNEVVFAGNRAELQAGGRKILDAIAPTLDDLPNDLQVDGHTNQLKVRTSFYPSGWELSTARASAVVRSLAGHSIAASRLTASGYSDTKPLISPKDPKSITMNRRVDVIVLSTLTAEQRALLPAAAGEDAKLHTGITTAEAAKSAGATTQHD